MKPHELRELTVTELNARLNDAEQALKELRFSKSVTGQLENPARIRNRKREVARLKTILKEKNSAEKN